MSKNKFDLHTHTIYSDGLGTVSQMVKQAEKVGLKGIAITDHNTVKGFKKIDKLKTDLTVIKGQEVSSAKGHILALGIHKLVPKHLSVKETIKIIHEQGGVAVAAHPFLPKLGIKDFENYNFDGFESLNANYNIKPLNKKLENKKNKMAHIAGSDSHQPLTVGRTYTLMNAESEDDVISQIKKGKTKPLGKVLSRYEVYKTLVKTYRKRKNKPRDAGKLMMFGQNTFALLPEFIGYPLYSGSTRILEKLVQFRMRKY